MRAPGAIALEMAEVAAGRYDFQVHFKPKLWDKAAGELFITEAGGGNFVLDNGLELSSSLKTFEQIKHLLKM